VSVAVTLSIELRVDAATLLSARDLEKRLAEKVRHLIGEAARTVGADGHRGSATFDPPVVTWGGPGVGALADTERAAVAARVSRLVVQAARAILAPAPAGGKQAVEKAAINIERSIGFHSTVRAFFTLLDLLDTPPSDRWAIYHDLLDTSQVCVALRLKTVGMMFLDELLVLIDRELATRFPKNQYFFALVWHRLGLQRLVALDAKALGSLKDLPLSGPTPVEHLAYVHPGSHMVLAVIVLPIIDRTTATRPATVLRSQLALSELSPLVDAAEFLAATQATWASYLHEWGNSEVEAAVHAFTVHKPVHGTTLRALYSAAAGDARERYQLGGLILLTRRAADALPSLDLADQSNPTTLALPDADVGGEWRAGWAGAYVSAWLPSDPFMLAAARYRPGARKLAATIVDALRGDQYHLEWKLHGILQGAFGTGHGYRDIQEEVGQEFAFFLEQLDEIEPKRTWVAKLYDTADEYYSLLELLVRFGHLTPYVQVGAVANATERIAKKRAASREHVYLPDAVLIDRRSWLVKGGNLAALNPMYLKKKEQQRLTKAAEAKLPEWMLAAAKEVVRRALGAKRELSKEDFSREVLEELQKNITKDDVESVTVERTVRLVGVREFDDHGVKRHFVKFNWVERIAGEGQWADAPVVEDEHGQPIVVEQEDSAFEEMLFFWSYAQSSAAILAFAKGVTYLATFVIAWEVGVFALVPYSLGFVAFNTLVYIGKAIFGKDGFSIDGLALAAVQGYAMALGFRFFAPIGRFAGTWLAERITGETVALQIASWLVQRAVSGAIIGAGTSAITLLATDLVLISMGGKEGFSGWDRYFDAMTEGAKWGIVFEFAGDAFTVIGKLKSYQAVAAAVRRAGWSPAKWWAELDSAQAKFGVWATQVAGEVKALELGKLLKAFSRELSALKTLIFDEAQQGLLRRIITLSKTELSTLGEAGLRRFLEAMPPAGAEPILRMLARNPAGAAEFLEALGALEDQVVAMLANRGQLGALAGSSRMVALLRARGRAGLGLINAFGIDVVAAEAFLVELERLPLPARVQALRFFEGAPPYPSPGLLIRALRHPRLVSPGLANLVHRVEEAAVPAAALDDLFATLERLDSARLDALTAAELHALGAAPELRAFIRARGDSVAQQLVALFDGDVAACERFLVETRTVPPSERAARIWVKQLLRRLSPEQLEQYELMKGKWATAEGMQTSFGGDFDKAIADIDKALEIKAEAKRIKAESLRRAEEIRQFVSAHGTLSQEAAVKILRDLPAHPTPAQINLAVRDLRVLVIGDVLAIETAQAFPGAHVFREVRVLQEEPNISYASFQAMTAEQKFGLTTRPGATGTLVVYRGVTDIDAFVIDRAAGGKGKILRMEQHKTGVTDTHAKAKAQNDLAAGAIDSALRGGPGIRLETADKVDITDQVDLTSVRTAEQVTIGPADKQFDRSLGITAGDLERLTKDLVRKSHP